MGMAPNSGTQQGKESQNTLTVSMAELKMMAQKQKSGGQLPVLAMMNEAQAQSEMLVTEKKRSNLPRVRRGVGPM
jgi:hypothetical protein